MKNKKGTFGYLKRQRGRMMLIAALLVAVIFTMYFGARAYFGTNQNLFTIFAALTCIPAGKYIVSVILYSLAKPCSAGAKEKIEQTKSGFPGEYDLYLTAYQQNYALSHVTVLSDMILALTEDPKCKKAEAEKHIRKVLETDQIKGFGIQLLSDPDQYCKRLSSLAAKQTPQAEDEEAARKVFSVLHAVSL